MTDTAALAAIGAATVELHLPTVRAESPRPGRDRQESQATYLAYLADVLAAEINDRAERRPADASTKPASPAANAGRLRPRRCPHHQAGHHRHPDPRRARRPTRRVRHRQEPSAYRFGCHRLRTGTPGPLRDRRPVGQRTRRSRRQTTPIARRRPLRPARPALPRRALERFTTAINDGLGRSDGRSVHSHSDGSTVGAC